MPRQQCGVLASAAPVTTAGGTAGRVRVSASALALIEDLCALDGPGGASLFVFGTSVEVLVWWFAKIDVFY